MHFLPETKIARSPTAANTAKNFDTYVWQDNSVNSVYFNPNSIDEIQEILTSNDTSYSSLSPELELVTKNFEEYLLKILDINKLYAEQNK